MIRIKWPYTHAHSRGVTNVAVFLAQKLGVPAKETTIVRRAVPLRDIGKLSVANNILDKPGKLSPRIGKRSACIPTAHERILERISGFQHPAFIASTQHGNSTVRATDAISARRSCRWNLAQSPSPIF